ncbi:unnamed protein product [Nezara viridula]|uniref:Uncharacterized protein n=1 Tax=Nezara viridula TaxID=85310 RepID=A0A9P0HIY4_NEZVI|nr:unnamed protein product [Nezara viridula]
MGDQERDAFVVYIPLFPFHFTRLIEFIALKADSWIQDQRCPSCSGKRDNIRLPCRAFTVDAIDLVKAGEFLFSKEPHHLELYPMVPACYEEGVVGAFSQHMGWCFRLYRHLRQRESP